MTRIPLPLFLAVVAVSSARLEGDEIAIPPKKPIAAEAFSFRPILGTTSPDGRYALGWGFAKAKVDWAKYRDGEDESGKPLCHALDPPDRGDGPPESVLVDLNEQRVVRTIRGDHFGDKPRYNHLSCSAAWSPDSKLVIQLTSAKWSYGVCDVYWRDDQGHFAGPIDLGAIARKAYTAWAQKHGRPGWEKSGDFAMQINALELTNAGRATLTVEAFQPDKETDLGDATVVIDLARDRSGKLGVRTTKVSAR